MAIDAGYQTSMVYQFCRQHKGLIFATKGHAILDKPFYKSNVGVNVQGQPLKFGLPLWHFNTDQMKSWIHSKIEWPIEQPGGWWVPNNISIEAPLDFSVHRQEIYQKIQEEKKALDNK